MKKENVPLPIFSSSHTLKFLNAFKSEVRIHYLLYDELPLLAKWVEVQGEGLDLGIDYVEVWSTSLSISTPILSSHNPLF